MLLSTSRVKSTLKESNKGCAADSSKSWTIYCKSSIVDFNVTIFSSFARQDSRDWAKDVRMALSTAVSQRWIWGVALIRIGLTKFTNSFSLLIIPVIKSPFSLFSKLVIPAYIFWKCRWTLVTSLLFPIISSRSSSPMK